MGETLIRHLFVPAEFAARFFLQMGKPTIPEFETLFYGSLLLNQSWAGWLFKERTVIPKTSHKATLHLNWFTASTHQPLLAKHIFLAMARHLWWCTGGGIVHRSSTAKVNTLFLQIYCLLVCFFQHLWVIKTDLVHVTFAGRFWELLSKKISFPSSELQLLKFLCNKLLRQDLKKIA